MNRLDSPVVVLISANAEWRAVLEFYKNPVVDPSPFGGIFKKSISGTPVIFVKSGWGKISAAASTQYCIQAFQPALIVNLGTCGGIAGRAETGDVILVEETLVYDVYERMGDAAEAVRHYSTRLDLSFLPEALPQKVRRGRLLSADQDIDPAQVAALVERYGAFACDWESGAIAWTAARNQIPCLILRAVTDLVSPEKGEIYDMLGEFHIRAADVMQELLSHLPDWITCACTEK